MSSTKVRMAVVSAALVAAGLAVGVAETASSATQTTEITGFHSAHPIAGETFFVLGTVATPIERPVVLQRHTHTGWKDVGLPTGTDSTGQFQISTSTSGTRTYRVIAHTFTVDSTVYPALKTPSKTITPVKDTVKLEVLPATVHVGHRLKFTMTFSPTRVGRPLTERTWVDGVLQPDFHGDQETGHTMSILGYKWTSADIGTYTFQLIADPWHGAGSAKSNKVTIKVVQ